jgi:DMSO/TMAO reductase YedYZ molybdopterin-dependent catalytic subunit
MISQRAPKSRERSLPLPGFSKVGHIVLSVTSISAPVATSSVETPSKLKDGFSGIISAALALGVSEFVAGVVASLPSIVESLGNWVIDVVPKPLKNFAIETFGTNDKLVLAISIVMVTLLLGFVVGVVARKRFWIAIAVFVGFAVVGALAGARDGTTSLGLALIPSGIAALAGLASLQWLFSISEPTETGEDSGSRRAFLLGAGAVIGLAALSASFGRNLLERGKVVAAGRAEVVLPTAIETVGPIAAGSELGVPDLVPIVVSNQDFYRIDTAFTLPRINLPDWRLKVTGRVDRPYEIDFDELLEMDMVERYVTLSCVSNRVGGDLVGNAKWLGVPLIDILNRAGVSDDAEQLVGRSVESDGFTVGFPVELAMDGREALVAVGMNDEPLPFEHGFPARLVVPGLYGYVSATKWLAEIELTGWDDFDAYWVPRGWSKEGPIKTQSRIDTPTGGANIDTSDRVVAGVAWAPTRGISMVEVQLGADADWVPATLSVPISNDSWVQWEIPWTPSAGRHQISVRATDGNGDTQTAELAPVAPNGATGYHKIFVNVA